jgi:hypothetical protein
MATAFPKTGGGYQYDDGNLGEIMFYNLGAIPVKTGTGTLTEAEVTAGIISVTTTATLTTPTGTELDTYLNASKVGTCFNLSLVSGAGVVSTLTGGAGVIVVGGVASASALSASFIFRKTGTGTWSAYRV